MVAEQQNLDLLLPLGATPEHEQLEESPERPVEQRNRDALRPPHHDR
jgi:hypothetical protein